MKKELRRKAKRILALALAATVLVSTVRTNGLEAKADDTSSITFTENDFTVTSSLTYTGSPQSPIISNDTISADEYTVTYSYTKDGETDSRETVTDAGTYIAKAKITKKDDSSVEEDIEFTDSIVVGQLDLGTCTVNVSDDVEYTYNGNQQKPEITVTTDSGDEVNSSAYSVEYGDNINAGTGSVTVKPKNENDSNVNGSKDETFTIKQKTITSYKLELEPAETDAESGNTLKVIVKETEDTTPLTENTDYTISYKKGSETVNDISAAGTYTVIATGKGNYTGSISEIYMVYSTDGALKYSEDNLFAKINDIYYYHGDVTVSAEGYQISDKKDGEYKDSITFANSDNLPVYIYLKSNDSGNDTISRIMLTKFVIDTVAPTTLSAAIDNIEWAQSKKIVINCSDSDLYGIYYATSELISQDTVTEKDLNQDGLNLIAQNIDENYEIPIEAEETYYIYAIDKAGNVAKKSVDVSKIDRTNPVIGEELKDNGTYWINAKGSMIRSFTASDEDSGISETDGVTVQIEGNDGTYSDTNNAKVKIEEGEYILSVDAAGIYRITAKDNAGNTSEKTINVKKDTSIPAITLTKDKPIKNDGRLTAQDSDGAYYFKNSLTIDFNITDSKLDGEEQSEAVVSVKYTDENGNENKPPYQYKLSKLLEDGKLVENNDGTYTYVYTISEAGTYEFNIADEAGNEQSKAITVKAVSKTNKDLKLELSLSGKTGSSDEYYNKVPTISGKISTEIGIAKIEYTITKDNVTGKKNTIIDYAKNGIYTANPATYPCESLTDLAGLDSEVYNMELAGIKDEGCYTVNYTVTDVLGNETTAAASFIIDTTKPDSNIYVSYDVDGKPYEDDFGKKFINLVENAVNKILGKKTITVSLYVRDGGDSVYASGIDLVDLLSQEKPKVTYKDEKGKAYEFSMKKPTVNGVDIEGERYSCIEGTITISKDIAIKELKISGIKDTAGNELSKINEAEIVSASNIYFDNTAPKVEISYEGSPNHLSECYYYGNTDNLEETVKLVYTEHFFKENVLIEDGKTSIIYPQIKINNQEVITVWNGESASEKSLPYVEWGEFKEDKIEAIVHLPYGTKEDGQATEYIITTSYSDVAENNLEGDCESEKIVLDNVAPTVSMTYPEADAEEEKEEGIVKFYKQDSGQKYEEVTLLYTERYFNENVDSNDAIIYPDILVNGKIVDVAENAVNADSSYVKWGDYDPDSETITAKLYLPYSTNDSGAEIEYVITTSYTDASGNKLTDDCESETIVLDNKAPELISYTVSGEESYVIDNATVYKNNTKEGDVKISFTIDDNDAYWQPKKVCLVITNRTLNTSTTIWGDKIKTWENRGREHTASYTFDGDTEPSNYYVTVSYTDKAGNSMISVNEDITVTDGTYTSKEFILDHVAPVLSVSYSTPTRTVEATAYYKENITVTFTIAEDYYVINDDKSLKDCDCELKVLKDNEEVTITIRPEEITWSEVKGGYQGQFTIEAKDDDHSTDGIYQVQLTYKDAAANALTLDKNNNTGKITDTEKGIYTSAVFVLDTTKPEVNYSYSTPVVNTKDDTQYFNAATNLVITVKDANIRKNEYAEVLQDEKKGIKSYTVNKTLVSDTALNSFVINGIDRTSIVNGTDKWELPLSTEAYYDIPIEVEDLAGNKTIVETQHVCVDTSKPTDLKLSYSVSDAGFLDVLNYKDAGFAFADKKLTVSLKANDKISGIKEVIFTVTDENNKKQTITKTFDPSEGVETSIALPLETDSFKGSVKATVVDYSTNSQEVIEGQIVESDSRHNSTGSAVITTKTRPSRTVNGVDYYNTDVTFNLKLEDTYSGLRSYEYTAGSMVSESYSYADAAGHDLTANKTSAITNIFTKDITITAADNNVNNVPVAASFVDNAGHTGAVSEQYNIDITAPTIEVTYDNNTPSNEKYYKETRTATVVITERNFNPDDVDFQITNTDGTMPSISGWTTTGSGDATKHTATVTFAADGDYTFTVGFQDLAGNKADYNRVDEFTIDKTLPEYTVNYDNNSAQNEYYYDASRTATIDIVEHNFNASQITVTVTKDGSNVGVPSISGWSRSGDHNIATITYAADGDYTFTISGTDMADNAMEAYVTDHFVVDTEAPTVEIFDIENMSANSGVVQPGIRYDDTNYDADATVVEMTGYHNGKVEMNGTRTTSETGVEVKLNDFEHTQEMDDLYTMKATVYDLAGNSSEAEVIFSVNRFGSVYTFDEATNKLVGENGRYYTNKEQDIVIMETNVDTLDFKEITCNLNGELDTLTEGEDFVVEESGSDVSWKQYTYKLGKELFEQEGTYTITIYSEDRANNTSDNNSKGKKVEFVIDKTKPSILISGIENDGQYREDSREVTIDIDDNVCLSNVVVDVDGEVVEYTAKEVSEADGKLTLSLKSKNDWQSLSVTAYDAAGNESVSNELRYLITSNLWIQATANKPVLFGVLIAIVAVVGAGTYFLIFAKKRKKDDKAQA